MNILDNYLTELFGWGKKYVDPNDPSLPNPYNFRQLELDRKLRPEDIKNAQKVWAEAYDKGLVSQGDSALTPEERRDFKHVLRVVGVYFVIVDKGKRVGIVGYQEDIESIKNRKIYFGNIIYVTWVRGKNYAAAGIMKMLNLPMFPQENTRKEFIESGISAENKASIKVAENLKGKQETTWLYSLKPPYWWNDNKILKY